MKNSIRQLESIAHDAAKGLSSTEAAVLAEHPDAVRSVLVAVAGILLHESERPIRIRKPGVETIRSTQSARVEATEADKRISARMEPIEEMALLTSDELAVRIGFKTRQSVHDWRRKGKIVGWRGAKRGYVFPEGQLDKRGRPIDGLDRVVPYFGDGYAAWFWLTAPRPSLNGETPITLMKRGRIDDVIDAAKGDRQGDFA